MRYATLLFALCVGSCSTPSADFMMRATQQKIDGRFAASANGTAGSTDTDELGMNDAETSFNPRVDLDFGAPRVTFEYLDFRFSGSGTLNDQIELGGVTIPANEPVDSDLDLALYTGLLTWDLLPTDMFELGLGAGIVGADISAKIVSQNNAALVAKTDEIGAIPVLAARAAFELSRFRVEALARGMNLDFQDVDTKYFDLDVYGRFRIGSLTRLAGSIDVGYRAVSIDVQYDDDSSVVDGNFEFSGPYAGITVSF